MTSKVSFFNLIKENLKQRIGTIAFSILCCFISWPLLLLIMLENTKSYLIENYDYQTFFYEFFYRNPTNIIIVSILAVICGMGGFFYLFSKKQVDFYHSLPVKREKLFLVSYLNGIFIYFIPYVICAGISFVISISYIGFSGEVLKGFLMNLFITGIFFLFLYEIVILAVILTGNKLSCFLMLGTLCFYMIATKGICIGYHDIFFDTFYYNGNLLAENRLTSPVIAILYGTIYWFNGVYDEFSGIDRPMMMFLLQCLGFAIFYGILNVWLFKKRPSEAAGRSIAFPMIQDIYRILLEIPFALGCGIFFCCITIRNNTAWLLFGILFGLLVSHFLLESLFHMDVKKALSHKLQLVITGGLLCLLAVSMRYDWWRYDAYLPKENKIKSMAISINGMIETDIVYYLEDTKEYSYSDQYILENMDIIDYEPIYEIAKKAVEAQNQKEREEGTYTWCKIKYSLTNGKDVYREYYIKREDDLLTQIINKPEYKNNVYQILTLKDEYIDELWVENIETEKSLLLEKEDIAQFLSIYREELNGLNFEEIKQTYPTAEISFRYKNGRIRGYQIYPSFTETRKYLKDLGFETKDNPGSFDSEGIESITVKVEKWIYEEEASYEKVDMGYDENVFIKEYTDIEQIKELCENLQVLECYYKYHNIFLKGVKNDYIYVIGKKRMKDGSLEQIEGYYLKEQIPNLIKEDFKIKE